ncbi:polyisoprenoid-binding protein [Rhodoblastus sphagnicola]|uniref:Polyisoprenoid-binding protein n=1 Tax=Rhodoblastus sphagnicola TaxID=333368 RepID=A0A2S6MVJ1_9HYPH|nr:YceI family protein [Rhodoblastus sphagnicola]MBB4197534.1 polyisoprenoid-binding protein YceI [Rhodoblastus sphagnicola]PPQ26372.1 polyisoprenoid-binding protein [Rhodoblastus sphagnicola]
MKLSHALFTAALLASTPVLAQAADPKTVTAGAYKIDSPHTEILFGVSHFGLSNFSGVIAGAEGTLKLNPAKLADTQLEVAVATQTVLTPVDKLTGELRDPEWLDSAKFPKATFASKKVTQTGADTADIAGELTLHGVTKPLTLHAKFVGAGLNPMKKIYTVGFDATGVIKRTEFGVSKYAPYIGDDVTLTIHAAFEAAN